MKKLLTILGSIGLLATTGATVVACGSKDKTQNVAKKEWTAESIASYLKNKTLNVTVEAGFKKEKLAQPIITEIKKQLQDLKFDIPEKSTMWIKSDSMPNQKELDTEDLDWTATAGFNFSIKLNEKDEFTKITGIKLNIKTQAKKTDLNDVFKDLDLGYTETTEKATFEIKFFVMIKGLTDQVDILEPHGDRLGGTIVVRAKEESKTYQGHVQFSYVLVKNEANPDPIPTEKQDIVKILSDVEKRLINIKSSDDAFRAVAQIVDDHDLSGKVTLDLSVPYQITVEAEDENYVGQVTFIYGIDNVDPTPSDKQDIAKILSDVDKNLGVVNTSEEAFELVAEIVNDHSLTGKVTLDLSVDYQITVVATDENYVGEIVFIYGIDNVDPTPIEKQDIAKLLGEHVNLPEFASDVDAFNAVYFAVYAKGLINDVNIHDIDYTLNGGKIRVTANPNSENYVGEVTFTYTLKTTPVTKAESLRKLLKEFSKDLGAVESADMAKQKVNGYLIQKGISFDKVDIDEVDGKIIVSADNDFYVGEVSFTYNLILNTENFQSLIDEFSSDAPFHFYVDKGVSRAEAGKAAINELKDLISSHGFVESIKRVEQFEVPNQEQLNSGEVWVGHPEAGNVWTSKPDSKITFINADGTKMEIVMTYDITIL